MKNPFVRSQVAKDVIKRVTGEAERLDARFSPVDDSRDLAGPRVGEDVHFAEVSVSDDQWVLHREECWKIFLYPGDRFQEAGGEVAGEVVETGVAVFRDGRNSIWIRSAAVLPRLRKESIYI
jgi:hypothetical protein